LFVHSRSTGRRCRYRSSERRPPSSDCGNAEPAKCPVSARAQGEDARYAPAKCDIETPAVHAQSATVPSGGIEALQRLHQFVACLAEEGVARPSFSQQRLFMHQFRHRLSPSHTIEGSRAKARAARRDSTAYVIRIQGSKRRRRHMLREGRRRCPPGMARESPRRQRRRSAAWRAAARAKAIQRQRRGGQAKARAFHQMLVARQRRQYACSAHSSIGIKSAVMRSPGADARTRRFSFYVVRCRRINRLKTRHASKQAAGGEERSCRVMRSPAGGGTFAQEPSSNGSCAPQRGERACVLPPQFSEIFRLFRERSGFESRPAPPSPCRSARKPAAGDTRDGVR